MKSLSTAVLGLAMSLTAASAQESTEKLIADLGSRSFKVRERASHLLKQNVDEAKLEEALKNSDPEIARRAELLLRDHYEKQAREAVDRIKEQCRGKLPWIDVLPHDDPLRGRTYGHLWSAQDRASDEAPDWTAHRLATEYLLLELAREKVDLIPVVERLKQGELAWIERFGKNHTPPLTPTWP